MRQRPSWRFNPSVESFQRESKNQLQCFHLVWQQTISLFQAQMTSTKTGNKNNDKKKKLRLTHARKIKNTILSFKRTLQKKLNKIGKKQQFYLAFYLGWGGTMQASATVWWLAITTNTCVWVPLTCCVVAGSGWCRDFDLSSRMRWFWRGGHTLLEKSCVMFFADDVLLCWAKAQRRQFGNQQFGNSSLELAVREPAVWNLQLGVLVLLRVEVASLGLLGQLPAVAFFLLLLLSLHVTSDLWVQWPVGALLLRVGAGTGITHVLEVSELAKLASERRRLYWQHVAVLVGRRHADLTRLAADGWGLALAVWPGRRRCRDASGQFPTVERQKERGTEREGERWWGT